jgi:hypothetical protein
MAVGVCAILACPALHAQSVADAARAAKDKKKKQADAAASQDAAKPKVYTNEDIPEAKSGDSQPAPSKIAGSNTKCASDAKTTTASDQSGLPHCRIPPTWISNSPSLASSVRARPKPSGWLRTPRIISSVSSSKLSSTVRAAIIANTMAAPRNSTPVRA